MSAKGCALKHDPKLQENSFLTAKKELGAVDVIFSKIFCFHCAAVV
jgi:hypothetical protein